MLDMKKYGLEKAVIQEVDYCNKDLQTENVLPIV